ncbi:MAG: protein kinase domain-containing protein [Planctomycetaceae bacterium]
MASSTSTAQRAREIFLDAIERHPAGQCGAFLDAACDGDALLRQQVERLLEAHAQLNSFMAEPAAVAPPTICGLPPEGPGTQIGPYKLLEQIGEGGMGVVYMAEQLKPVRRKVALKIIKPGMDTREFIARFDAERQALALMDHPNIARVFDAGATPTGRPYFVMELVRGIPITDYCDQNDLSVREWLELFVTVCHAVQHAHQKGIIHRDIKPSNVLVTMHDGTPVPKVIDFGVAKAIGQQLTDKTLFTKFTQIVGTPLYMSPEQAELSVLDVDTRSDVYSLGVLMYELLTGTTPIEKQTLSKVGIDEMRRIIREEEPARPSQRLSTLASAKGSTVVQKRGMDVQRLSGILRGELDWIVMKALEKDRTRRYESASALAADVQRYLDDEPVEACPPSVAYRLRKLTRRHKVALVTTGIVALAMLIGTAISFWQMLEANRARRLADDRLTSATQAREDADEQRLLASQRLESETKARRDADAQREEADRQRQTAEEQRKHAEASFRNALQAVDQLLTRVGDEKLANIPGLEAVRTQLQQDALKLYDEFLAQRGDDPALRFEIAHTWQRVGEIIHRLQLAPRLQEALPAFENAVRIAEALKSEDPNNHQCLELLATCYLGLSKEHAVLNQLSESETLLKRSLAVCNALEQMFPDEPKYHLLAAEHQSQLANRDQARGRLADAKQRAKDAIATNKRWLPEVPDDRRRQFRFMIDHLQLAWILLEEKDVDEADKVLAEAQAYGEGLLPGLTAVGYIHDPAIALAVVLKDRAWVIRTRGAPVAQLEEMLRRAIALLDKYFAARSDQGFAYDARIQAHHRLGQLLDETGRFEEAERFLRLAWDATKQYGKNPWESGVRDTFDSLYSLLQRLGRSDEARAVLDELCTADLSKDLRASKRRALAFFELGRFDEALAAITAVIEMNPRDPENLAIISLPDVVACPDESFRAGMLALADKTIEQTNGSPEAHGARAALHLAMGDFGAAQRDLGSPDGRNERERAAIALRIFQVGDGEFHRGKYTEALPPLDLAIQWNPGCSEALDHRGQIFLARGEFDKALADFDEAVLHGAKYGAYTYGGRATAHFRLGHYARALADLSQVPGPSSLTRIAPSDVAACPDENFRRGMLAVADEVVRQNPQDADALIARALLRAALGDFAAARADLDLSVSFPEAKYTTQHHHALACLAAHDEPAYRADCAEMLRQSRNSRKPEELHSATWTCVLAPDAVAIWEPVLDLAARAVELGKGSMHTFQAQGAALFRAGKYDEALPALDRADAAPANPLNYSPAYTWYFLAMTQFRLGNTGQARAWFDKAAESSGNTFAGKNRIAVEGASWNRRLILDLLHAEASQMLGVNRKSAQDANKISTD